MSRSSVGTQQDKIYLSLKLSGDSLQHLQSRYQFFHLTVFLYYVSVNSKRRLPLSILMGFETYVNYTILSRLGG